MPFIGNQPAESYSAFQKQDFTTSATTSYTLDHPVSNQNELALFINFVRQEPTTAYTASGTSLSLTSATTSSDDMYCVYLGKAVQTVNPPNGSVGTSQLASTSVTSAKLNNDIISGTTALTSEPADTDEFLVSDAGTLKRIDYSLIKGGGITMVDMYRLTADLVNPGNSHLITSNLERVDDATSGFIGTGMSLSSGVYTFPSTGIYRIAFIGHFYIPSGDDGAAVVDIFVSSNSGSSYDVVAEAVAGSTAGGQLYNTHPCECFVDVTNASTFRVKFEAHSMASSRLVGSSSFNATSFSFIRLGDT